MKKVYLSLGTNKGDKYYNLIQALVFLNKLKNTDIINSSSFYETKPIGPVKQDDFINMAVLIQTDLKPYKLLEKIHIIEKKLKRERKIHWGPRTIDIDIIFYEDINMSRKDLKIPHIEFKNRNFVIMPILEIVIHKNLKNTLLNCLKKSDGKVTKIKKKKNVMISSCLMGINCKYDGTNNYTHLMNKLNNSLNFIMICPEILGGMPTPRKPVEIDENGRVINKDNKDFTQKFKKGAMESLKIAKIHNSNLAILKSKSPSCGYGKIYDGTFQKRLINGNGITTKYFFKNNIKIISE